MSDKNNDGEFGSVKIATDVILTYISSAVLGTQGVADFSGGLSDTISQTVFGKENRGRGIKLTDGEKGLFIDIYVIIKYGERIPETAWNIQQNVKAALEKIMNVDIESINIHVQGVSPENASLSTGETDGGSGEKRA
jgi:uncharacterized alkaline shock family protein YloU